MPSANSESLTSSLPNCTPWIFLLFRMCLANESRARSESSGYRGHPCQVLLYNLTGSEITPGVSILALVESYMSLKKFENYP